MRLLLLGLGEGAGGYSFPMREPVVFVLEDDTTERVRICETLDAEGYRYRTAGTGQEFLGLFDDGPPQAVILGVGLPDIDGRDVCRTLRSFGLTAPIIFVTRSGLLVDKLAGFDAGCDDYVVKPFEPEELAARLRALRRLGESTPRGNGGSREFRLDPSVHSAASGDASVRLSPTEYRVLAELAARPGQVVRRNELIHSGWPRGAVVHENTLDAYMWRIRRKLSGLPDAPRIETVHGVGYSLGALPANGTGNG